MATVVGNTTRELFETTLKYDLDVFQAAWSGNLFSLSHSLLLPLSPFHLSCDLVRLMVCLFFFALLTFTLDVSFGYGWIFFWLLGWYSWMEAGRKRMKAGGSK